MKSCTMDEAWAFARVDEFWKYYTPFTPWGRDERDSWQVFNDRAVIEAKYDDIELAITWIRTHDGDPVLLDRMSFHLKRIPRFPTAIRESCELTELFQVKKFIANYRGVLAGLGTDLSQKFGFGQIGQGTPIGTLSEVLSKGGPDSETFYLSDGFDPDLASFRKGIAKVDAVISNEKAFAEVHAAKMYGIYFDGREFLVVPKESALDMASSGGQFALEPYDNSRYIVRILPSVAMLEALGERERLRQAEQVAEDLVIARISMLAREALPFLLRAMDAVTRWDLARAGAVLALSLGMVRPAMDSVAMVLSDARFIPCQDECTRLGLDYTPLSSRFDGQAVVLFGSNMGGKTVMLQTVLFFQLVAQAGLFVPARNFRSCIYDRIEYVGERSGERLEGLSGFGLEVWRLGKVRDANGSALVAFDELARTTGSHEAEALLSAVVEVYSSKSSEVPSQVLDRAFFATHFRGVARLSGAEYRSMRGLDRNAVVAALSDSDIKSSQLAERLSGINRFMRYEVIDDDGSSAESDALSIAALLGLDAGIVERAQWYLHKEGL